jgi:hypothetical protein
MQWPRPDPARAALLQIEGIRWRLVAIMRSCPPNITTQVIPRSNPGDTQQQPRCYPERRMIETGDRGEGAGNQDAREGEAAFSCDVSRIRAATAGSPGFRWPVSGFRFGSLRRDSLSGNSRSPGRSGVQDLWRQGHRHARAVLRRLRTDGGPTRTPGVAARGHRVRPGRLRSSGGKGDLCRGGETTRPPALSAGRGRFPPRTPAGKARPGGEAAGKCIGAKCSCGHSENAGTVPAWRRGPAPPSEPPPASRGAYTAHRVDTPPFTSELDFSRGAAEREKDRESLSLG